ncbi:MAG: hypothetical protein OFPII_34970 [Osedax symbiont Rs1]|nr:MAG: hypothetical protein OFPII_34970 [Osedax symbiont Rs1]
MIKVLTKINIFFIIYSLNYEITVATETIYLRILRAAIL